MKIWKNLFGWNDKIHVDEIAVAQGLLLGGAVIVESRSNQNGNYVKFGDGTVMVYTNKREELAEIGLRDFTYAFPITFMSGLDTAVIATIRTSSWGTDVSRVTRATAGNSTGAVTAYTVTVETSKAGITVDISIIAIGRWK